MPSHQQNLDAVRSAAVRANPEIRREKFNSLNNGIGEDFGKFPDGPHYIYREITALDVLLALGELGGYSKGGSFYLRPDGRAERVTPSSVPGQNKWEEVCRLDLRATLSSWDEATVAVLANLLKKDE